jgi:nucleotide-binding universal stress UspA family protein
MFKHVLIPTDGSELSGRAVRAGVAFAKSLDAKVSGLFAMAEYPVMAFGEPTVVPVITPEEFLQEGKTQAQKVLAHLKKTAQEAGVDCEIHAVVNDLPYKAIIETATQKGCDVIFMASHGRRVWKHWCWAARRQQVLTHSKIPVVVTVDGSLQMS